MIADDPKKRPSIEEIEEFLTIQRATQSRDRKITAKDLGIKDDLQIIERSISNDVKRRAEKFEHCPFSRVNIMNSLNHLTSYEELSKAGYFS